MSIFFREILTTLILALVIFLGLQTTVQRFVIDGPSMMPNFHDGQQLLVNKAVYKLHEPERGDVVIFHPPYRQEGDLIKRIIGLPGESIEIKEGTVYIHQEGGNALPLDEPYITEAARQSFKVVTIPVNSYFVLGDNRNNSNDSRSGWTLPRQNIIGKAWLSIWPSDEWGLAANYPLQKQIDSPANR